MKNLTYACLTGLLLGAVPTSASATSVVRASLGELTKASAVIFHGVVRFVDDDLAVDKNGPFQTAIDFEVIEPIKGVKGDTFRLVLPGGQAFGREMRIPGMPRFAPGDEVVLLLERTHKGFALAGFSQGVFRVDRSGTIAKVIRNLDGIHLMERPSRTVDFKTIPTLADLKQTLRGGVQ